MEKRTGYLSSAWHELTSEQGWWHPVLILGLVSLIPIVGMIFVAGYLLNWAREGAWGMTRGIAHEVGDLGKRGKWGLYAIVISFVWILPFALVGALLDLIPVVGWLLGLLLEIGAIIAGVIASAACVYAVIYDKLGAGFQFKRLVNMARRDAGGLARCFCIGLLPLLVGVIAAGLVSLVALPFVAGTAALTGMGALTGASFVHGLSTVSIEPLLGIFGLGLFGMLLITVITVVAQMVSVVLQALLYRAYGYWVGQFKPAEWGGYKEPMPFEREDAEGRGDASGRRAPSNPNNAAKDAPTASGAQGKGDGEDGVTFDDVKEKAAAAAGVAGAYAQQAAHSAAEAVSSAAAEVKAGFATEKKPEAPEGAEQPVEVEAKVEDVADGAKEKAHEVAERAKDKAEDAKEAVREKAHDVREKAGETAERVKDKTHEAAEAADDKAHEVASDVKAKAHEAAEAADDKARDAKEAAREKARDVSDKAHETAEKAKDAAEDAGEAVREKAHEAAETIEGAAERAKDKAEEMGEAVRDKAHEVAGQVKAEVSSEGDEKPVPPSGYDEHTANDEGNPRKD